LALSVLSYSFYLHSKKKIEIRLDIEDDTRKGGGGRKDREKRKGKR
jgi:hypothetical protein